MLLSIDLLLAWKCHQALSHSSQVLEAPSELQLQVWVTHWFFVGLLKLAGNAYILWNNPSENRKLSGNQLAGGFFFHPILRRIYFPSNFKTYTSLYTLYNNPTNGYLPFPYFQYIYIYIYVYIWNFKGIKPVSELEERKTCQLVRFWTYSDSLKDVFAVSCLKFKKVRWYLKTILNCNKEEVQKQVSPCLDWSSLVDRYAKSGFWRVIASSPSS